MARSNEAKRLGVRMGQPAFELRDMIERGELCALSGNHLLYHDISLRVHDIFRRFAPRTLDYSIDEAFLDMEGIPDSVLHDIGEAICDTCLEEEHIPVTVGFAPTKTLAKIATETGKQQGKRVITLLDETERLEIMSDMSISELWGIGRRLAKRLYMLGVYTIGDLASKDLTWVRAQLGINGERTWREIRGESCIELSHVNRKIQDSISETRTFPTDIGDFDYIRSRIAIYSAHVCKRLRSMGCVCGEMSVFLATNRFHTERGYAAPSATVKFTTPIADTAQIASTGINLVEQIFNPALRYKRAGVVLSHITSVQDIAPSLFEDMEQDRMATMRSRSLMKAIDRLNRVVGTHVLKLATEITTGHIGYNDGYSSSFGPAKRE